MKLLHSVFILLVVVGGIGCEKKVKVPAITEWTQFQDPFFRVTFSYPKSWHAVVEPNKVILYSSQDAMQKFFDPTSEGKAGAQIIVAGERDSLADLNNYVSAFERDKKAEYFEIKSKQNITIDTLPAVEFQYAGRYDQKTTLTAARAITLKDSTVYYVHYGAYNEWFDPYKVVYDSVIASMVLPKPRVFKKDVDPSLPVEETEKLSNEVLDITYPANFSPSVGKKEGEATFALELKGYRQDCIIGIDVRPAKGLGLDKVVEQNSKRVKVTSKGSATIGGERATYLNYSPMRDIESRMYFIVKNDKVYRIIWNYYAPMRKSFQPAFEKTVASLRIK